MRSAQSAFYDEIKRKPFSRWGGLEKERVIVLGRRRVGVGFAVRRAGRAPGIGILQSSCGLDSNEMADRVKLNSLKV